jgi:hypothetical protein
LIPVEGRNYVLRINRSCRHVMARSDMS